MLRLVLALTAGIALAPALAADDPFGPPDQCTDRQVLVDYLAARFAEAPRFRALDGRGFIVEWLVSPAGSWTMLATLPDGPTCAVATGERWEDLQAGPGGSRV